MHIRLLRVHLPLVTAHRAAHGSESIRDVVLIEVAPDDGPSGWGDCSTLSTSGYVTESTDRAWQALVTSIGPATLASGTANPTAVTAFAGAPAATAAMRDAVLDAGLRRSDVSLSEHLGGRAGPLKRCAVLAGVGLNRGELVARAVAVAAGGAAMVKLKIMPGHDRGIVEEVVDAVHPLPVAVDANGSYTSPFDLEWLDDLDLAYIEQPFPAALTPAHLGELASGLATPVALDESVLGRRDVEVLAAAGAGQIISLKPLRMGGVAAAVAAGREAVSSGLDVFVGGMLETGIGRAGALAVASAFDDLPTDLGPSSSYFSVDVCEPIECEYDGTISPPTGPGLGRTPSPEVLERVVVDEVLLRN